MKRIEEGEIHERNNAAFIIYSCIHAEESCRSFLADNIKKSSLLELIVLGNSKNCSGCAFSVLAELLYLDRYALHYLTFPRYLVYSLFFSFFSFVSSLLSESVDMIVF